MLSLAVDLRVCLPKPEFGLLHLVARRSRGSVSEVVAVAAQKEVLPRRTVEFPDAAGALLAVDHARTPKPRTNSPEITLCIVERNRVIVLALVIHSVIGDGELQPKELAASTFAPRVPRHFPSNIPAFLTVPRPPI